MTNGQMDNLAVAKINMALLGGREGLEKLGDLERIDAKTPFYKEAIERDLSVQQRRILIAMVKHGRPARIRDIAILSRIWQQNNTSSQVTRMVKKGYLERLENRTYFISSEDPDLLKYLRLRLML